MASVLAQLESLTLRALFSLPRPVLRAIAGRPVVRDGNELDLEIQALLRLQKLVPGGSLDSGDLRQRRDGMLRDARLIGGVQPIGRTEELTVDGAAGELPARLYVPRSSTDDGLLVFFHGGGFTLGDLDSHDAVCRYVAEQSGARVLAVDYRLAPEHPYPAGPDDAWAALQWAAKHAADLDCDPDRIAVGGDSAGGSLSAITAVRAAEAGLPLRLQLLVYPATRLGDSGPSRKRFGEGFILTDEAMDFFEYQYLQGGHHRDPGHSAGFRTSFPAGLAPAVVAIAGFDPLRDEEKDYVALLREHGCEVTERFYPGFTHGFFNMVGYGRSTRSAVAELAQDLRRALSSSVD